MAAVRSFDGDTNTPWVNSNVEGPLPGIPGPVTSLIVCRAASNDSAKATWGIPSSGSATGGYNVVYRTTKIGWQRIYDKQTLTQVSQTFDPSTESLIFGVQAVNTTFGAGPWRNTHWVDSSTTACP